MASALSECLIIRADASTQVGTGHLMRCLALAQAWQAEGGRVILMCHCESEDLRRHVEAADIGVIPVETPHTNPKDLGQTLAMLRELQAGWLALDGYHFDPAYQQAVRTAGYRVLVIDDTAHWPEYHADILVNQNINAEQLLYVSDSDTTLLLGTRYVLLRPEFRAWYGWRRETPDVAHRVLVTLGGGDPDNVTLKVIRALQQVNVPGLEVKIVVGSANPHLETLSRAVESSNSTLELLMAVTNMSEVIAWADVAISAGGSTCWELAFMGVPGVVLVLAENQRALAEELGNTGVAVNLGWHEQVAPADITQAVTQLMVSAGLRTEMARRGRELVDGDGIDRVLMRLRGERIRLRKVREEDGRLLWEWANDSSVRAVSFSPEPIPWERHLKWLRAKLNDPNCVFWIAINEEEMPIGQVRCDVSGQEAVISIGLGAKFRGKGYGSAVIQRASQKLYQVSGAKLIHAYVRTDNEGSLKAFSKAGFRKVGTTLMRGQPAVDLILPREGVG